MEKEYLPELLKKYLRGECTPQELEAIDEWFLSHEHNPDDARLINNIERERLENKMLSRIKANVQSSEKEISFPHTTSQSISMRGWYKVAASLAMFLVAGLAVILYSKRHTLLAENNDISEVRTSRFTNTARTVATRVLSDGTVIMLQPNGSVEFPEVFPSTKREILLTGEAFFDVTKDKNRPFIITTGEVTIKVLGTSFNVKAYHGAKEITVAVKTGKVSVYAKTVSETIQNNSQKEEIILTPNQEVVYNTVDENFSKKIVANPQIILAKPTLFEMRYDATPVSRIFKVLEDNYGIDIVYDEQTLSACSLTTSMSEEGLYERIEIICQAIGAQYEMKDAKILISSSGCQ